MGDAGIFGENDSFQHVKDEGFTSKDIEHIMKEGFRVQEGCELGM